MRRKEGHLGMKLTMLGEDLGTAVDVHVCIACWQIWQRKWVDFRYSQCC